MRHPRSLEAGDPARGLATRLHSALTRVLRQVRRRAEHRAADDVVLVTDAAVADEAQFTAHVEQALQIIREVSAPRVVRLPGDRSQVRIRG